MALQLPFERTSPLTMPPILARLQNEGAVHKVITRANDEAWLVVRHEDVKLLFDDDRLGRSHPDPENAPKFGGSLTTGEVTSNFETEKEDMAARKVIIRSLLTPTKVRAFVPAFEALAEELLDTLERSTQPADLNAIFVETYPILAMCTYFGIPREDFDRVRAMTQGAADNNEDNSKQGMGAFYDYAAEWVARRRGQPADDVITELCEAMPDNHEAAALLMRLMYAAQATTVMSLGWGILYLLANREQWELLERDPDVLPATVEETLRSISWDGGVPRWARVDFEYKGVQIKFGELVLLNLGAANHDPSVFEHPHDFDGSRRPGDHIAFGYGSSYCPGAAMARQAIQTAVAQLIRRFPGMQLAIPPEDVKIRTDLLLANVIELPVTW